MVLLLRMQVMPALACWKAIVLALSPLDSESPTAKYGTELTLGCVRYGLVWSRLRVSENIKSGRTTAVQHNAALMEEQRVHRTAYAASRQHARRRSS